MSTRGGVGSKVRCVGNKVLAIAYRWKRPLLIQPVSEKHPSRMVISDALHSPTSLLQKELLHLITYMTSISYFETSVPF
jgi:hypothetical protein